MKKRSLVFLIVFALVAGSLFSTSVVEASESNASLQKQIKSLKSTVSKQNKQMKDKDKQIKSWKSTSTKQKSQLKEKDKKIADLNKKISYSVVPLKTKVAFQGNEFSGNTQIGTSSIPVVLDYKGIKYSPVDLIGGLLNYKTIFNKTKDTVYFGVEPSGSYMSDILKPYYSNDSFYINQSMKMGEESYNKGYAMEFDWYSDSWYSINLAGKYAHISGIMGMDDSSDNKGGIVKIYGDDNLLGSYELEKGGLPLNIDLDVSNVKKLEITANTSEDEIINFANLIIN